jgi:hypothetical protein
MKSETGRATRRAYRWTQNRDVLAWYLGLMRRRPLAAVLALLTAAVALSVLARLVMGDRGALVPVLLYLVFGVVLAGFLGLRFTRAALDPRPGSRPVLIPALPLDAFALFVAAQLFIVAADLALPFETVEADVVGWSYHPSGRGPGSIHLTIADGTELEMPPLSVYGGVERPGLYRLELTRIEHLVISATLRD